MNELKMTSHLSAKVSIYASNQEPKKQLWIISLCEQVFQVGVDFLRSALDTIY